MDWALSNAIGDIKLKVVTEDADKAMAILKEQIYDRIDPELEEKVAKSKPLFRWAMLVTIILVCGLKLLEWEWDDASLGIVFLLPIWILLIAVFASGKKCNN